MQPSEKGDGSFEVSVVYLPDESRTYAIDAQTKGGTHALNVTVKDGLLEKIVWNEDESALAAAGATAAGAIAAAELERANKERDEDAATAKKELGTLRQMSRSFRTLCSCGASSSSRPAPNLIQCLLFRPPNRRRRHK